MIKYGRVTLEERCQIVAFLQVNMSQAEIARALGRHKSTVLREIRKNSTQYLYAKLYRAGPANKLSTLRRRSCRRKEVITGELEVYIRKELLRGWSPDNIAGRYRLETERSLSHQTIYTFIGKNEDLKQHLRWGKWKGAGRKRQKAALRERFASIHDRPQIANQRKRIGDWERDGMYGANRQQLLVCTDRKTRFTKIAKMPSAKSFIVGQLTMELLKSTGKKIFTITNDNGPEFRGHNITEARVFHCDPMKPQQRGTVEHTIGMLRKYVSKKADLSIMSEAQIKELEDKINLKPRKILGYMTPYEKFYKTKVALAI